MKKVIICKTEHQGWDYAARMKLNPKDFVLVSPTNWQTSLCGLTFGWSDITYLDFEPTAYPEEFYQMVKICTHEL